MASFQLCYPSEDGKRTCRPRFSAAAQEFFGQYGTYKKADRRRGTARQRHKASREQENVPGIKEEIYDVDGRELIGVCGVGALDRNRGICALSGVQGIYAAEKGRGIYFVRVPA